MDLAFSEMRLASDCAPALTENVFRLAIHQRHGVDAGEILDKVAVELQPPRDASVHATVYIFALHGRHAERRCFAWAQEASRTTTIVHTILESRTISDAAQAVRATAAPTRPSRLAEGARR